MSEKLVPTYQPSGNIENMKVYLSSGFQPPNDYDDLLDALDVTAEFQSYASGGAILHVWLSEELNNEELEKFVRSIAENLPVVYFTVTPYLTVCNQCGYKQVGRIHKCPKCGSNDVTQYSRPIGYFRPVERQYDSDENACYKFWLDAKIEEYKNRLDVTKEMIEDVINSFGG